MRLLIAVGGAAGAVGRTGVGLALPTTGDGLSWATLAVNVTGALALGWLLARVTDERVRAGLGTGFLGSWTTFSAFAVQPLLAPVVPAVLYLVGTVVLGVVAYRVGARLGSDAHGVAS